MDEQRPLAGNFSVLAGRPSSRIASWSPFRPAWAAQQFDACTWPASTPVWRAGCPVAFADLATHLLRDDRAATCDEAAAAVKRDAALQRQLVEGVVYALEWILDSINVQQTGRGSPAGGAEGRAAGERPYGALPPEQLWHAAAQAINSLTSDLFLWADTELARTEPESLALAPAGRVLRLLSAAGPELSDDCRVAVTTFTCRLCGVAGRAITTRHEPAPASASWAVLRMLPDAAAALRWLEKSEAAKGSASSSPQATGMTPSTLDSASLVWFGFLMQVPTTAPEVNSPAHAAVWCCAGELAILQCRWRLGWQHC